MNGAVFIALAESRARGYRVDHYVVDYVQWSVDYGMDASTVVCHWYSSHEGAYRLNLNLQVRSVASITMVMMMIDASMVYSRLCFDVYSAPCDVEPEALRLSELS